MVGRFLLFLQLAFRQLQGDVWCATGAGLNVGFDPGFGPVVCGIGIDRFDFWDARAEVIVKAMENGGARGARPSFRRRALG